MIPWIYSAKAYKLDIKTSTIETISFDQIVLQTQWHQWRGGCQHETWADGEMVGKNSRKTQQSKGFIENELNPSQLKTTIMMIRITRGSNVIKRSFATASNILNHVQEIGGHPYAGSPSAYNKVLHAVLQKVRRRAANHQSYTQFSYKGRRNSQRYCLLLGIFQWWEWFFSKLCPIGWSDERSVGSLPSANQKTIYSSAIPPSFGYRTTAQDLGGSRRHQQFSCHCCHRNTATLSDSTREPSVGKAMWILVCGSLRKIVEDVARWRNERVINHKHAVPALQGESGIGNSFDQLHER